MDRKGHFNRFDLNHHFFLDKQVKPQTRFDSYAFERYRELNLAFYLQSSFNQVMDQAKFVNTL